MAARVNRTGRVGRGRRVVLIGAASGALLCLSVVAEAGAHSGGVAVPVVTATVRESGPLEALVEVRLRDEDGGGPVRGATVRGAATMTTPHVMLTYFGPLPEVAPGRYRARVELPMAARWR
jgi:hypothetical protein